MFRYTCVVDALLGMAYYSSKVAYEEKLLVNVDCSYYPLHPKPLTGNEPDAWTHFPSKEDFEKYKWVFSTLLFLEGENFFGGGNFYVIILVCFMLPELSLLLYTSHNNSSHSLTYLSSNINYSRKQ